MRRAHPIKGLLQNEGDAHEDGHEEARDESHIVIQRKPRDEDIVAGELKGAGIGVKLIEHSLMRKRDAFLQACGT